MSIIARRLVTGVAIGAMGFAGVVTMTGTAYAAPKHGVYRSYVCTEVVYPPGQTTGGTGTGCDPQQALSIDGSQRGYHVECDGQEEAHKAVVTGCRPSNVAD
jgi:hypothetical protein